MSRNLKTFLQEDITYTARDVVQILTEAIPGRSVGEKYVVSTELVSSAAFIMELDDGSKFLMTCKEAN